MSVPEPGRYGVVRTPGFVAWLIRLATRSPYNHAFVFGENATVIEADVAGVRVAPLAQYRGMRMATNMGEPMTAVQLATVLTKAESMEGYEYNFVDLGLLGLSSIGIVWRVLFRLLNLDKHIAICSQMVAECGAPAGMDWQCGKEYADEVTPALLAARPGMVPYAVP